MKHFTKIAATGAIAALLVPTLALAHDGKRGNDTLEVRINKGIERIEKKDFHDAKKEDRKEKQASTTAAAYSKKAVRIQAAVDTMLSFDARLLALIASSSAEGKAALEAKYAEFKADAENAKIEAGKVISASAQVNAQSGTTTNAALLAQAKVDLKESRGFFVEAKLALFSILRALWS